MFGCALCDLSEATSWLVNGKLAQLKVSFQLEPERWWTEAIMAHQNVPLMTLKQ